MDYLEILSKSLLSTKTIVMSAKCSISYSGRAESFLDSGDRIIIIKSDGTILIHQLSGSAPVNWMKESVNTLVNEGGLFVLKSSSIKLKEQLNIFLEKIHFINVTDLIDTQSISIVGTEKDMSDMIFNKPELIEKGFMPLSREEHTKYGFIDVFGYDKHNILTVIECKRYNADLQAVTQLRRYVEKVKNSKGLKVVRGILAAPKISANAEKMLKDWGFSFVQLSPPKQFEEYNKKQKSLSEF